MTNNHDTHRRMAPVDMLEDARIFYELGTHEAAFIHMCGLGGLTRAQAEERLAEFEKNRDTLPNVVRVGIIERVMGISTQ